MKRIAYIITLVLLTSCQQRNYWECEGDCWDGEGTKIWKDGGIERGTWKDGDLIGEGYQLFGKTSDFAGNYYEGEFNNGYHGYGTYHWPDDDVKYIGYWKNGKHHGKGIIKFGPKSEYPNRYYEGNWKNGMKHGHGFKFWGDAGKYTNNKYIGEWYEDDMEGFGKYEWGDSSFYEGYWQDGYQHGKGIYVFQNGDTLVSQWIDGYCRELDIILHGENPASFIAWFDEVDMIMAESGDKLIKAITKDFTKILSGQDHAPNFTELKKLYKLAYIDLDTALVKINEIEEWDNKIPLKKTYNDYVLSFKGVLDLIEVWLMAKKEDNGKLLLDDMGSSFYEHLEYMKAMEDEVRKNRNKFVKKFDL